MYPTHRLATAGIVLVAALAVTGVVLHAGAERRAVEEASLAGLQERARTLALALTDDASATLVLFERLGAQETGTGAVLVSPEGRGLAGSSPASLLAVNWQAALSESGAPGETRLRLGDRSVLVATHPAERAGGYVVAVADAPPVVSARSLAGPAGVATGLVLPIALLLLTLAWMAGPRVSTDLRALGVRLATLPPDAEALLSNAETHLGPTALALEPLHARLSETQGDLSDSRSHVAGLFQINPHYVVLCTLDGTIVEANPAFYAVTGLPFEVVRGGRVEALREVFPVEPLLELAERSAREGSAITGIDYALVDADDASRAVQVSLRAVRVGGRPAVLIQATDVARQRTLERQIATFSDSLDLMVDRRVAQLTAAQSSLSQVLDAMGVVVVAFDASGATRRWNRAAEALTARPPGQVPHVTSFVSAIGLPSEERADFLRWFWTPTPATEGAGSADTFVTHHLDRTPGGTPCVRPFWWRKIDAHEAGRADHHTLLAFEGPRLPAFPPCTGDGQATAAALPSPA